LSKICSRGADVSKKAEEACGIKRANEEDVVEVWNMGISERYVDARDERQFERGKSSVRDRRSTKVTGPEAAIRRTRRGGGWMEACLFRSGPGGRPNAAGSSRHGTTVRPPRRGSRGISIRENSSRIQKETRADAHSVCSRYNQVVGTGKKMLTWISAIVTSMNGQRDQRLPSIA